MQIHDNKYTKYQRKHLPGDHYNQAFKAISSETGILGTDKNGDIVASGTISKEQATRLFDSNTPSEGNDFVVEYDIYEALTGEFAYKTDLYIEKHKLLDVKKDDLSVLHDQINETIPEEVDALAINSSHP